MAVRIMEYLTQHPNAMDTIEGIARFWLGGDFTATPSQVDAAVQKLVEHHLVKRYLKPDGEWIYGLAAHTAPEEGAP